MTAPATAVGLAGFGRRMAAKIDDEEFELAERLMREAGLSPSCPCVRHSGFARANAAVDPEEITRIESIPCSLDEIAFNRHCLLSGLGARDLKHRWETFDNPDNAEMVHAYADNLRLLVKDGVGLTLVGRMGTGKTSAATFIARKAIELWGGGRVTVTNFHHAISAYNDPRLATRLQTSRLLVVDEVLVGRSESQKQLYDDRISQIIVPRYQSNTATLITANHSVEELEAEYPRLMSRLGETNETLVYTGDDHRQSRRRTILDATRRRG